MPRRPPSPVSPLEPPPRPQTPYTHDDPTERRTFAQSRFHEGHGYKMKDRWQPPPNSGRNAKVPVYKGLFPLKQGPGGEGTLDERLRGRGGTRGRAEWLAANARGPLVEVTSEKVAKPVLVRSGTSVGGPLVKEEKKNGGGGCCVVM